MALHEEEFGQIQKIPPGWDITALANICLSVNKVKPRDKPNQPFTYLDITSVDNSTFRVVSPKLYLGRDAPSRARQKVRSGDTLFSTVRTYLKNVAMIPPDLDGAVASTGFCVLRPANGIDRKFLFNLVLDDTFATNVNPLQRGTSYPAVRDRDVLSQKVFLPSLAEQHRIVAEIERHLTRIDASVAALKRVQANLKRYRASVLNDACEGKLVPTEAELARGEGRDYEPADRLLERILAERRARWESQEKRRGKYKGPVTPDTSNLPELPEGWAWVGLDQLATVISNGYAKRPRGDIGTPILRISAVRPLSVDLQDIRWVDSKDDLSRFLVHPGDLLFTRYNGNRNLVGVCGVVAALDRKILHPDKLIRTCLTKKGALSNFVQIVANSGVSRKFLERRIRTTAGQSGISGSDLKSMPIPLPPLAEQHRIVAEVERRLSVIQQAEAIIEANLTRAERLRQSILKQAFSGKLVPQDPNDEPASVLLERIRAEREAAQAKAKPGRKPRRRRTNKSRKRQTVAREATS